MYIIVTFVSKWRLKYVFLWVLIIKFFKIQYLFKYDANFGYNLTFNEMEKYDILCAAIFQNLGFTKKLILIFADTFNITSNLLAIYIICPVIK